VSDTYLHPFFLFAAIGLLLGACDSTGESPSQQLRYFKFVHPETSGTFVAATSESDVLETLEAQLNKSPEARNRFIAGPIARGDAGYNDGHPWHFVEGEWTLVESAVEVCDGAPSYVDEHVDYFVEEVGRYCPWSARVQKEVKAPQ
jgi:hypothetical protein